MVVTPRLSWYRSFYWRIGITFVAFVVVFLIIQGIILQRTPRTPSFDVFHGPVLAAAVAADVAERLGRGQTDDLGAHTKGVAIRIQVDAHADQVMADPDRIEQAIENLVANALRHSPAGGTITLHATQADGVATLSVSDGGGGIAPEHLPHVFERFYKADAARAADSTGSGLGLSITKAIIERHGGTIAVRSRPGQTVFTIQLPQAAGAA